MNCNDGSEKGKDGCKTAVFTLIEGPGGQGPGRGRAMFFVLYDATQMYRLRSYPWYERRTPVSSQHQGHVWLSG
jgi:hypothetical protein